jgi:hypothetical protein
MDLPSFKIWNSSFVRGILASINKNKARNSVQLVLNCTNMQAGKQPVPNSKKDKPIIQIYINFSMERGKRFNNGSKKCIISHSYY